MPAAELARLRQQLAARGLDGFFVAAPETLPRVNLRYLSGFTGSSAYLLVTAQEAWLLTDFRYVEQAEAEAGTFEVRQHERPYLKTVAALVNEAGLKRIGFEADKVPVRMWQEWREALPAVEWVDTGGLVEDLRVIKTPAEVEAIRRAAAVADRALEALLPRLAGSTEAEWARALETAMREAGADRLAFPTIVASGPRGSLPHAQPTDRTILPGDLVTIDFGATVDGYNSDETVTVVVGTPREARQREIFEIVRAAQAAGLAAVRPGVYASRVDEAARSVIRDAGYGPAFGHSTGHGVGLEVHEAPTLAGQPAVDRMLEPGMVVTVEPGIYLPGWGGVRLEDTVVVTETGYERLTRFPKEWRTV
jgi:Xaa-Pro aminopeptidase